MGIWVGRYAIVAGEVREHGPWLVERERAHGNESVRLLVLADPVDERSAEFCEAAADAVAALFGGESLSLTGGLLRALQRAHANLAEWNRRSLREHRVAVGMTCVVIREGEVTVAQAGPGAVYVAGPRGIERHSTEGSPAEAPLGGTEPVEPQFFTAPLAGHQFLLVSSGVEAIGQAAVGGALAAGPERALAELFTRTRELSDMTAVLIADLEGIDDAAIPPVDVAAEFGLPPEPAAVPAVDSGSVPAPRGSSFPSLPSLRRPRVAGREAGSRAPWVQWRVIALIAAAVIAVVAIGLLVLPPLLEEDRETRLAEAIAVAEQRLDAVAQVTDVGERRRELQLALSEVERARSIDPEDGRVAALESRAEAASAALDAVIEVSDLTALIEFEGVLTEPFRPPALIAGDGVLWLLDDDGGRIFAIDPAGDAAAVEVYRSGERYEGVAAADPVAIAWDGVGDRLLLFDAARTLFAITSDGPPRLLAVRDADELRSVEAIASYDGNLYVLDPEGGEVWRYLPAGGGYDSERTRVLGGAEIEGATALVVDGDLFVLEPDGVSHFRPGVDPTLLLIGIDRLPGSPAGIVEDVERGRFYVADRAGDRIVVSDRGGDFVAQFRHLRFSNLLGLALSADGTELYVLTGDGIFVFAPGTLDPGAGGG